MVLKHPEPVTLAVLRRLAPRARLTVGIDRVEMALAHLEDDSRRGRSDHPHGWLLAGRPPLATDGAVRNRRVQRPPPLSPRTVACRGRSVAVRGGSRPWSAVAGQSSRPSDVAGIRGRGPAGCLAGKWLAALTAAEAANVDPERRVFAELQWEYRFGDRHTAMTVLVCGAEPARSSTR